MDIESFISKDYLYHEINGKLIASYDPRSTERKSSAVWDRLLVTKRKFSRNWLTAIVAIVGIIAFLIIGIREYERALNEMGFGLFS